MSADATVVQKLIAEAAQDSDTSFLSEADREDIQALVLFGTKSAHLRYHFFTIATPEKARQYIQFFLDPGPLAINTAGTKQSEKDREHLVYVGFTWKGLRAIGLDPESLKTFPADFREGSRSRAAALGDVTEDETRKWTVSDDDADLVVMLYSRKAQDLFDQSAALIRKATQSGCALVKYLDAQALPDFNHPSGQRVTHGVHFGFSDGIGQPRIGKDHAEAEGGRPFVKPGAFVLGHPDPKLAATNHDPLNPPLLGINGTFGAFRIFEQDCDAFEEFLDRNAADPAARELLAARMCGRWRNGLSLAVSPDNPHVVTPQTREQLNDFDYAPTADHPVMPDDARGLRCPIGAHARRANPRSSEILGNMGHAIRLIRRGLPYGPPHVRGDGKKRGMLGLFLCASLENQFEFIMRHWINDGLFARGLNPAEKDPLVGAAEDGTFTYRTSDGSASTRGVSRFITTRGGAYLFFPSRTALGLLAGTPEALALPQNPVADRASAAAAPTAPPPLPDPNTDPIGFIKANIIRRVDKATNRDAHPKHHGLVKAEFQVLSGQDLEAEERQRRKLLLHGLFEHKSKYTAYIRFSNGSPLRVKPDGEPDLRGVAIKLFRVEGPKLSTEQSTHDFILASDPRFFVKNLRDYPTFLQTSGLEQLRLFPLLGEVFRRHENPLTIRYFSQTPYRCGPLAVKYSVVPEDPAEEPNPPTSKAVASRGPDYLREAMAVTLAERDVTMRFMLQIAPEGANEDDATELWTTPFTTVARITIPRQEFRSKPQMAMAENTSFNPWHAIKEHEPLGSINKTRRDVYEAIAHLRRSNGGVSETEPDGTEI